MSHLNQTVIATPFDSTQLEKPTFVYNVYSKIQAYGPQYIYNVYQSKGRKSPQFVESRSYVSIPFPDSLTLETETAVIRLNSETGRIWYSDRPVVTIPDKYPFDAINGIGNGIIGSGIKNYLVVDSQKSLTVTTGGRDTPKAYTPTMTNGNLGDWQWREKNSTSYDTLTSAQFDNISFDFAVVPSASLIYAVGKIQLTTGQPGKLFFAVIVVSNYSKITSSTLTTVDTSGSWIGLSSPAEKHAYMISSKGTQLILNYWNDGTFSTSIYNGMIVDTNNFVMTSNWNTLKNEAHGIAAGLFDSPISVDPELRVFSFKPPNAGSSNTTTFNCESKGLKPLKVHALQSLGDDGVLLYTDKGVEAFPWGEMNGAPANVGYSIYTHSITGQLSKDGLPGFNYRNYTIEAVISLNINQIAIIYVAPSSVRHVVVFPHFNYSKLVDWIQISITPKDITIPDYLRSSDFTIYDVIGHKSASAEDGFISILGATNNTNPNTYITLALDGRVQKTTIPYSYLNAAKQRRFKLSRVTADLPKTLSSNRPVLIQSYELDNDAGYRFTLHRPYIYERINATISYPYNVDDDINIPMGKLPDILGLGSVPSKSSPASTAAITRYKIIDPKTQRLIRISLSPTVNDGEQAIPFANGVNLLDTR